MLRKFKISIDGTQYLVEMEEVGAHVQSAPMPGTILDIHVKVGDPVTANQPIMVLEAMKMENEVVADKDGVIASIDVAKGAMVNPGDALFSIA